MDQARLRRLLRACLGIRPLAFQDQHEADYQPDPAVTVQLQDVGETMPGRRAGGRGQAEASRDPSG
jgi:hypothetical protein